MSLQDFIKVLRTRWITVCATVVAVTLGAVAYTFLTTPEYAASTRLFVSTTAGSSLSDAYQGNRFSKERVVSYSQLIMGETLAQRTIDKLGLDMKADELQSKVRAGSKVDTVLIDVEVLDESPVRARDIANTLSDEFVAMVRELETPEDGASPDSRVVVEQRASIPESPVIPKTSRNLAIGFALGVLLGMGLAVVRDFLDNTVKTRADFEEISGTSLVGSIPMDKERRKNTAISFENVNSPISEAFRKLRTNLQFLAVDNPPRVIVFTSSMPHEGKSTTAINVALALAEADHTVVLVDGDLRRAMIHKYLDLIGAVGFSTVLSGAATLGEALQKTRYSGLTVLAAGAVPPNPSELLGSQAARKLLAELREKFDYVIVDSTPLLAVTDAAVLAAGADGVLLMARYGQTKREQLTHAVSSLENVGAPLLGAVFTMVPARGGGAYSSYGYYGTYGESDSKQPAGGGAGLGRANVSPSPQPGTYSTDSKFTAGVPGSGRRRRK
ncbi:polysaccharide biosynthesis tyrosine autokinase [Mycobacterium sp. SMC-8]|uniref:polysaccharide biosynthesis tyrosine autokinase n=1 Tax=Mycobacterium sp. SMC-8 TaxID=2857060 RepID=UPI0021B1C428|nr:polysaccharide biosynthesis tyrosine autokinase [Mycobacterium sp. SMC-8]UXA14941.1 polysaccharide biosynthesis tyrosine autokinase [Mycobacterium sp. SMC-8]